MWEPRCFTTLWAFTTCYRDSLTLFYSSNTSPVSKKLIFTSNKRFGSMKCMKKATIIHNISVFTRFIDFSHSYVPIYWLKCMNSVKAFHFHISSIPQLSRYVSVRKVSANFCGYRVSHGQRNGFPRSLISFF
jgi:hypothetical protein